MLLMLAVLLFPALLPVKEQDGLKKQTIKTIRVLAETNLASEHIFKWFVQFKFKC